LEDIHQDLTLLVEQGKIEEFFNNVNNADKLGGLVEDIRDAMVDYQVCMLNCLSLSCLTPMPDFIAARHLRQELPAHREFISRAFRLRGLTSR